MVTEKIKDIITNMVIDNGLITKEMLYDNDLIYNKNFMNDAAKIHFMNMSLFNAVVNKENILLKPITLDYIEFTLVSILYETIKYRGEYFYIKSAYRYFNSIYDVILETINEINNEKI